MYFLIINFCVLLFFLSLIFLGLKIKIWTYVPVNLLGVIVCGLAIFLDTVGMLDQLKILVLFILLIIVFVLNFIITYQDIREVDEEGESGGKVKYLTNFLLNEPYKIVGNDVYISKELEKNQDISVSDRTQAFQAWKLGNQAYLKKEYKEALELYDLSNSWVNTSSANLNQSGVLLKIDHFEESLKYAEKALNLNHQCSEAYINLAYANQNFGRSQEAVNNLEKAASIKPDSYEIWYILGKTSLEMSNIQRALEYFNRSIRLNSNFDESWFLKGVALKRIGKPDEAMKCFDQVVKLNSSHHQAYFNKGQVLNEMDFNDEAIASFDKALKIKRGIFEVWNERGTVLTKKGKVAEAIKSFQQAIKIKPDYDDAWMNLAFAQDNSGKLNNAMDSYQKFLNIVPKDKEKYIQIVRKRLEELQKGRNKTQKKMRTAASTA